MDETMEEMKECPGEIEESRSDLPAEVTKEAVESEFIETVGCIKDKNKVRDYLDALILSLSSR